MFSYFSPHNKELILASKDINFWKKYNDGTLNSYLRYNAWWTINGWKENPSVPMDNTLNFIKNISNQYIYFDNGGKLDALQYSFYLEWERIYSVYQIDSKDNINIYKNDFVKILSEEINLDIAKEYLNSKKNKKVIFKENLSVGIIGDFSSCNGISEDAKLLYLNWSKFLDIKAIDLKDINNENVLKGINILIFCIPIFHFLKLFLECKNINSYKNVKILYAPWELSDLPNEKTICLRYVDTIWSSSKFTHECYKKYFGLSSKYVPFAVSNHQLNREFEFSNKFNKLINKIEDSQTIFFLVADLQSWSSRKNPQAGIEAFIKAIKILKEENKKLSSNPKLIVKINGDLNDIQKKLHLEGIFKENIIFINSLLTKDEYAFLLSKVDAVISLHRSEGYGRVPAEAMLKRIPAVVTNYSGNTDYANNLNSYLVGFKLTKVSDTGGYHIFTKNSEWAEPNIEEASSAIISIIKRDKKFQSIKKELEKFIIDNNQITINQINLMQKQFIED